MPKLIFRGVNLRYVDMRQKDGIIFSRLHLVADMTRPVAEQMGWQAALDTDGWESMKLAGTLRLSHLIMKVTGLKQQLQIKAEEARDFIAVRITDEEGGATHTELRFLLVTPDHPALIYEYWNAVGEAKAQLSVTLQDEPQQELPLEGGQAEQIEAADPTDLGPALASKAEVERAEAGRTS